MLLIIINLVQDTVVALQALAEFTALVSGSGAAAQNLSIRTVANGQDYGFETITSANSLVLQSYEVIKPEACSFRLRLGY
jgi:hypothetical protein